MDAKINEIQLYMNRAIVNWNKSEDGLLNSHYSVSYFYLKLAIFKIRLLTESMQRRYSVLQQLTSRAVVLEDKSQSTSLNELSANDFSKLIMVVWDLYRDTKDAIQRQQAV